MPQMAYPLLPSVDPHGISPVRFPDCPAQAIFSLWHGNQMDVIGHQTIGKDGDRMFVAPLPHDLHIVSVVIIAEENRQPAIASLDDVMRLPRNNDACYSRHGKRERKIESMSTNRDGVPPLNLGPLIHKKLMLMGKTLSLMRWIELYNV